MSVTQKNHCLVPEIWGGLECTINRIGDGFRDQLLYTGHYTREDDIDQFASLGIKALRYPVLWERHQPKKDKSIDWGFAQRRLEAIKRHNIIPIVGLLHHGSGPSFTDLCDPNFASLLADYARQTALQFPWVQYYTPVNEPLTTARFSGLYGHWYPHHRHESSFIVMLLHQLKGVVMCMKAIREVNPAARLIQTEDLSKIHSTGLLAYQARFENERRWLTFDLLCGKVDNNHYLWNYLLAAGIKERDILYFKENPCPPDTMGLNYYITSERFLDENITAYPAHQHGGNEFHQYAVTEAHLSCTREEQMRWWFEIWQAACKAKNDGVDLQAVTAWSLLGSYDWNSLLTEYRYQYDTGVFDISNNNVRPTATARLIKSMAAHGRFTHPLLMSKGWWQRSGRLLKPIATEEPVHTPGTAPLLIIAENEMLRNAWAEINDARGIFCIILHQARQLQSAIDAHKPWAIINSNGHTTIQNLYRQSFCYLVNDVSLSAAGLQHLAHASLNLLIDGETGAWHLCEDGRTVPRKHLQRRSLEEKIV